MWQTTTLRSGMRVQYRHYWGGAIIKGGGFWLHLPAMDWEEVEKHFAKRFPRPPQCTKNQPEVVVIEEPDGGAMLGMLQ